MVPKKVLPSLIDLHTSALWSRLSIVQWCVWRVYSGVWEWPLGSWCWLVPTVADTLQPTLHYMFRLSCCCRHLQSDRRQGLAVVSQCFLSTASAISTPGHVSCQLQSDKDIGDWQLPSVSCFMDASCCWIFTITMILTCVWQSMRSISMRGIEVAAENKVAGGGERPWRNSPPMVKPLGQQLQVQMKIYVSMIET